MSSWGAAWASAWGQSWGPTAGQLTAPSGMRRLQLYQLQEEVLKNWGKKKDEQPKEQESTTTEAAPVVIVEPTKPRTRRINRRRAEKPRTPDEPIIGPFVHKVSQPVATVYDALSEVPTLCFNAYSVAALKNAVIISLDSERNKRRQHNRRRAAALLLLAA